jgi:hypothetical protein
MNRYFACAIVGLILLLSSPIVKAQNVSRKRVGDQHKTYTDSLKATPYPWQFPILGAKLRKMGFDIPYPNGLMVNYVIGSQYITLDNLNVGPSPDNLTNVDGLARFESIIPFVNVVNLRYNVWLFPFLNVYALGGYVHSVTDVNLALPFSSEFTSISNGPMAGWGIAAAAGVGPIFFSADYSMAWTFMPQLDGPSVAKVFDIRVGHTFYLNNYQASNISFLVGAQYL